MMMEIDPGTVLGIIGTIAGPAVAVWRTSENAKKKAYDDARKDLGKCNERSEALAAKSDGQQAQIDILGRGLNECIEKHDAQERISAAIRDELNDLRRSISTVR